MNTEDDRGKQLENLQQEHIVIGMFDPPQVRMSSSLFPINV